MLATSAACAVRKSNAGSDGDNTASSGDGSTTAEPTQASEEITTEENAGTEEEQKTIVEYVAPSLDLTADIQSIPLGESTQVTFTVQSSSSSGTPELYCDGEKVADFENNGSEFTAALTLKSDIREIRTYSAALEDDCSNEIHVSFWQAESEAETAQIEALLDRVQSVYLENAPAVEPTAEELLTAASATREVLEDAINQGIVADYSVDSTGYTVSFTNGVTRILELFSCENMWSTNTVDMDEAIMDYFPDSVSFSEKRKIALLQPYYSEDSCTEMEEACRYITENYYDNFELIVLRNVTIETLKHLDDFDIVVWEGHGGYSKGHSSPFLSIPAEDPPVEDGVIVYGGDHTKAYLTSDFFDTYYDAGDLDGMLFYIGACCSAQGSELSDVLMRKGASMVVGFSANIAVDYNHSFAQAFFQSLLAGDGKSAFQAAKNSAGSRDPYSYLDWELYYNWFCTGSESTFDLIVTYDDYFAKPVCVIREGGYIVPIDSKEYSVPGLMFLRSCTWRIIMDYGWDDIHTFDVFWIGGGPVNNYYDWTAECQLGTSYVSFFFLGEEGTLSSTPISVMITTSAGEINGYDDVEFITGLHAGMSYSDTEEWFLQIQDSLENTPFSVTYTEPVFSDDYWADLAVMTLTEDVTGQQTVLTLMFRKDTDILFGAMLS